MRRGELWWANLGAHRPQEQTGRRPVVIWQSDALNRALQSVLVVPLTAIISASPDGPPTDSVALAFQMRAIPKTSLDTKIRSLSDPELAELELATDEALGRVEPE